MWKKVVLQEKRNDTIGKERVHMSKFYLTIFEQLFKMTRLNLNEKNKSERMYSMCETNEDQSENCTIK
jgi:hypothetical protein